MNLTNRMAVFLLILFFPFLLFAGDKPIGRGEPFPEISFEKPVGTGAAFYLGVLPDAAFSLDQVQAELVLVELLSVYCLHCQMQVEYFNKLRKMIEENPVSRGRIKLLGVAVASKTPEVEKFIERFQVGYPVVPDPQFRVYHALRAGVTPFSVYVRQAASGKPGVVAGTHTGLNEEPEKLYEELCLLANSSVDTFHRDGQPTKEMPRVIESLLSEEELEFRVRTAFTGTGGVISTFSRLSLPGGRHVYMADMQKEGGLKRLFAEVSSRLSICDICHDVHFMYLFDSRGKVLGFEPLQLTKWKNEKWTASDIMKMRSRLAGSDLTSPPSFDHRVDAVSSATITSAVIFDAIGQGGALLRELSAEGYLKD